VMDGVRLGTMVQVGWGVSLGVGLKVAEGRGVRLGGMGVSVGSSSSKAEQAASPQDRRKTEMMKIRRHIEGKVVGVMDLVAFPPTGVRVEV
jgi:hypothetical protein